MRVRVIGVRGQRALVKTDDDQMIECLSGRKQPRLCCGDEIIVDMINDTQCALVDILPRQTLLYRADPFKKKLMAANITQVVIIAAVEPAFSDELISRIIVAANLAGILPVITLNKVDIQDEYVIAKEQLSAFEAIGIEMIETGIGHPIDPLLEKLTGEFSLLIGQSGMGKSTLLNRIIPSANAITQEISSALNSGKHTTTASTLYDIEGYPKIVDSPGLQQFGLYGHDQSDIELAFTEFLPYLGHCHFANCHHQKEPDCAIVAAVQQGQITQRRLDIFHKILSENSFCRY